MEKEPVTKEDEQSFRVFWKSVFFLSLSAVVFYLIFLWFNPSLQHARMWNP
ncbi:MAG: hypothetical protein H0W12_09605 [Chitinophagaceae bacterium]|nr:hypothetical protein [Chitinophagaceae bacterium]